MKCTAADQFRIAPGKESHRVIEHGAILTVSCDLRPHYFSFNQLKIAPTRNLTSFQQELPDQRREEVQTLGASGRGGGSVGFAKICTIYNVVHRFSRNIFFNNQR